MSDTHSTDVLDEVELIGETLDAMVKVGRVQRRALGSIEEYY